MLSFDPNTRKKYTKNITLVVWFAQKWCDGNSLEVAEWIPEKEDRELETNFWENVRVFASSADALKLDGGYITRTGEKWIFSHQSVLTRCGCGKSFSFKSGNEAQDKIAILRKRLRRNKQHH